MREQGIEGVIIALQGFLREQGVDVVVTRAADPGDPELHLLPVKLAFVPLVGMPGLWDEVMLGKQAPIATA